MDAGSSTHGTSRTGARYPLSGAALLRGSTKFTPLEIPEITDDVGNPGIVYLRPLSTAAVLEFNETRQGADDGAQNAALQKIIAQGLVDEHGKPLFANGEDVSQLDFRVFIRVSNAVTGLINGAIPGAEKAEPAPTPAVVAAVVDPNDSSEPVQETGTGSHSS